MTLARQASSGASSRSPTVLAASLGLALALGALRTALAAIQDGYGSAGWWDVALVSAARRLGSSALLALPFCLALTTLSNRLEIRGARALRAFALLLAIPLAAAFVTSRLPEVPWHVPDTGSSRGRLANGGAALAAGLAVVLSARFALRTTSALRAAALTLSACVALASSAAHLLPSTPGRWPERPNVLLISIDTLRQDRLGIYGHTAPTSPALDRLARNAVRFERAYTPFPWTLTAHATLLTGRNPSAHGIDEERRLASGVPTLAKSLRTAGYRTAASVDAVRWMSADYGLDEGFDLYHAQPGSAAQRNRLMEPLLDDLVGAPFFLFLHYYDVHSDDTGWAYHAAEEDVSALLGAPPDGYTGCADDAPARSNVPLCASRRLRALSQAGTPPDPQELALLSGLYDAGVRTFDRELGRLLERLDQRGLLDETIVIVTADHGESLFEHGEGLHLGLWEETLRVPLLVRTPETREAAVDDRLVGLRDLAPTVLQLCGLPADDFPGRSFAEVLRAGGTSHPGPRNQAPRSAAIPIDAILLEGRGELGVVTSRWKWLRGPDGVERLYDLSSPRAESEDLSASRDHAPHRERLAAWAEAAQAEARGRAQADTKNRSTPLGEAQRESLRALGYGP